MRVRCPNMLYMCEVHVPLFLAIVEVEQLKIQHFKCQTPTVSQMLLHGLEPELVNAIEV